MPTPPVSADLMTPGGAAGGKHWTRAEVEARQKAAEGAKRKGPVRLIAPDWLTDDARKIWKRVRRQAAGLELLDNLDADMLAIYCDAISNYQMARAILARISAGEITTGVDLSVEDRIKTMQAWARLISAYADKLGFTPAARARLVKKKADEVLDPFGDEFDG